MLTQPSKYDPRGEPLNPGASRIVNLQYNGAPIDPDPRLALRSAVSVRSR